ncbi:hypothetical protein CCMA1212_006079 [Trichoderma ghanense]|uniref:Uncharacterized protein n=1 Tax=Trichoderma ghanense TaxID=65468 RepID=A0ABY2H1Q4_9HYPO
MTALSVLCEYLFRLGALGGQEKQRKTNPVAVKARPRQSRAWRELIVCAEWIRKRPGEDERAPLLRSAISIRVQRQSRRQQTDGTKACESAITTAAAAAVSALRRAAAACERSCDSDPILTDCDRIQE